AGVGGSAVGGPECRRQALWGRTSDHGRAVSALAQGWGYPVNIQDYATRIAAIREEVARVLVGQEEIVDAVLVGVFARGHVLIEGAPGLGKTLLVRPLGQVLRCSFRRIQFTPDLMPSDVTGGNVFNQQSNQFVFHPGPLFAQLVLADEINRAPAKTQSALLEAMQEASVTADGTTRALPRPFFVLA